MKVDSVCLICEQGYLEAKEGTNKIEHKGQTKILPMYFSECNYCGSEQASPTELHKNKSIMGSEMTTPEDKVNDLIKVATKVYLEFKNDGFYGEYVLGEELWNEFSEKYEALCETSVVASREEGTK